eukprot:13653558-Alexandrium_andersonii.AAC.1
MPRKWNTVRIASHRGGRNLGSVCTYFHQDVHEKDRPSWNIGPASGQGRAGSHTARAISGRLSKRAHICMRDVYCLSIVSSSGQKYISIRFST